MRVPPPPNDVLSIGRGFQRTAVVLVLSDRLSARPKPATVSADNSIFKED